MMTTGGKGGTVIASSLHVMLPLEDKRCLEGDTKSSANQEPFSRTEGASVDTAKGMATATYQFLAKTFTA
jgi:hypothetical protein